MNTKIFVAVCIALIISIFANVALGFNVSSKSQEREGYAKMNNKLKEEIKMLEKGLIEAEEIITNEQLVVNEDAKQVVKSFFETQYEYNTDTYKERYEKIKPFVNKDVYGQLTAAGIPDVPKIKFENKINDLKLYLTAQNNELTGLVLLDTVYNIEGLNSPENTQIFQVKVAEVDGQQQIVYLEILGAFAAMTDS
ncbi:hypothetical protein [Lederbergia lenta]|uniref:hypothetical protein n=1 Tax=Lederbergia lenta TaxID=1467 RepID=UPI00203B52EA|nr:hypothetical protein [Lederbergia lenta]MCM3113642.1 hypothetical protein [Lederbergia lenta]